MEQSRNTEHSLGVTFDLWLTLIAEKDGTARSQPRQNLRMETIHRRLQDAGHDIARSLVEEKFQAIYRAIVADQELGHDAPFEERVRALLADLGAAAGKDLSKLQGEVEAAIDEAFIKLPPLLLPGALDTLSQVAAMGHRMALISNSGFNSPRMYGEWLMETGITQFMQHVFISNAHECAKPSEHAFKLAVNALGLQPEQTLHIGDNPVTDIGGAKAYGMCTVLVGEGGEANGATHPPDFKVDSIAEIPAVVTEWARSLRRPASS